MSEFRRGLVGSQLEASHLVPSERLATFGGEATPDLNPADVADALRCVEVLIGLSGPTSKGSSKPSHGPSKFIRLNSGWSLARRPLVQQSNRERLACGHHKHAQQSRGIRFLSRRHRPIFRIGTQYPALMEVPLDWIPRAQHWFLCWSVSMFVAGNRPEEPRLIFLLLGARGGDRWSQRHALNQDFARRV